MKIGDLWSVAFSRNGDMMVTQDPAVYSRKMSVITDGGQFIEQFSEHLTNPIRVFVKNDSDGHVIVCDKVNIKILSPDCAQLVQSFSAPGCSSPPSCVFYHHDMFFVSYAMADSVKVFNEEGVFLYNIGSEGSGKGQFKHPRGLVVDAFDNLIVCDFGNKRLQMLTLDGKFLTSFGQEIKEPWAATVCKNGDMLVTDLAKDCFLLLR